MIARRSLAGCLVLAACAHGSHGAAPVGGPEAAAAPAPSAPAPSTAPVARPILYQAGITRYASQSRQRVTQEMMGQQQSQEFGTTSYLTLTIAPGVQAGSFQLTVLVDSVVVDSGMPAPPGIDFSQVRGTTVTGTLSARGEVTDLGGLDSSASQMARGIVNSLRDFLPQLPAAGLSPMARWTDTTDRKTPTGAGDIAVHSVNTYETGAWGSQGGLPTLELTLASSYTLAGTLSQGGQDLNLDGVGIRHTRSLLTTAGRYLGGETTDSSSMTVLIPAAGMSVPVTQVQRTTVKALP